MRTTSRLMQVRGAAAGALLLPWLACAQAADTQWGGEAAKPKAEAKKGVPAFLLGKDGKPADADAPPRETVITANKIDFDRKNEFILFDGNVLIDDAQFTMRSEQLIIFTEGTNDVNQIVAVGNVNITNDLRHATCDKAVYTKKDSKIVMTTDDGRDVHLMTRGDRAGTVSGPCVVFWLDDEVAQVFLKEGATNQPKITLQSLSALKDAEEKKPPKPEEKREHQK